MLIAAQDSSDRCWSHLLLPTAHTPPPMVGHGLQETVPSLPARCPNPGPGSRSVEPTGGERSGGPTRALVVPCREPRVWSRTASDAPRSQNRTLCSSRGVARAGRGSGSPPHDAGRGRAGRRPCAGRLRVHRARRTRFPPAGSEVSTFPFLGGGGRRWCLADRRRADPVPRHAARRRVDSEMVAGFNEALFDDAARADPVRRLTEALGSDSEAWSGGHGRARGTERERSPRTATIGARSRSRGKSLGRVARRLAKHDSRCRDAAETCPARPRVRHPRRPLVVRRKDVSWNRRGWATGPPWTGCSSATGPGSGGGPGAGLPAWVRDGVDTSDIVHDALHRTFVRLESFRSSRAGALRAYLQRAVESRIHDQLRRVANARPAAFRRPTGPLATARRGPAGSSTTGAGRNTGTDWRGYRPASAG